MLDQSSWLPQAQELAIGQSARVAHDCGEGHTMIVEHLPTGYRAHCFRCNDGGFVATQASLGEMMQELRSRQQADKEIGAAPPTPVVTDLTQWSPNARLWLYKAGFSPRDIARLGWYYHPPSKRVVLPVVQDGTLVYWSARAVERGQQPKYLNPRASAKVIPTYGTGDCVVLTEDILSAAKVGKVTESWSMLGTSCKTNLVAACVQAQRPILVWLDDDTAGHKGAVRTLRTLRAAGVKVGRIMSDRDPKNHSTDDIRTLVDNALEVIE